MHAIELFSKEKCPLCVEARAVIDRLQDEYEIHLQETKLEPSHPRYEAFHDSVPVLIIDGTKRLSGRISEDELRRMLQAVVKPCVAYYVSRLLEGAAIALIFVGFVQGLFGDVQTTVYLFISGVAVFVAALLIGKGRARSMYQTFARGKAADEVSSS